MVKREENEKEEEGKEEGEKGMYMEIALNKKEEMIFDGTWAFVGEL